MASTWQSTEISFGLLHSPFLVLWKRRKTKEACPFLRLLSFSGSPAGVTLLVTGMEDRLLLSRPVPAAILQQPGAD